MTLAHDRRDVPVVVVSGLPRSGTSLVMSMLDAGGVPALSDHRRVPDENNPRGYYELEAVKATGRDASWVDAAAGRSVKVIHALLSCLPSHHHYEVVLVERDLFEVVASQRAMLARAGGDFGDPSGDADWVHAFARQMDETRRWLDDTPCVRWTSISHRRLMRDPDASARALASFLTFPLDVRAMAAQVDPSLYRSRSRSRSRSSGA